MILSVKRIIVQYILVVYVIQVCEDILESLAINYYVTCSPNLPRGFPGLTLWQQRWDTRSRSLTRCQGLNNHPFKGKIFDFYFFIFFLFFFEQVGGGTSLG